MRILDTMIKDIENQGVILSADALGGTAIEAVTHAENLAARAALMARTTLMAGAQPEDWRAEGAAALGVQRGATGVLLYGGYEETPEIHDQFTALQVLRQFQACPESIGILDVRESLTRARKEAARAGRRQPDSHDQDTLDRYDLMIRQFARGGEYREDPQDCGIRLNSHHIRIAWGDFAAHAQIAEADRLGQLDDVEAQPRIEKPGSTLHDRLAEQLSLTAAARNALFAPGQQHAPYTGREARILLRELRATLSNRLGIQETDRRRIEGNDVAIAMAKCRAEAPMATAIAFLESGQGRLEETVPEDLCMTQDAMQHLRREAGGFTAAETGPVLRTLQSIHMENLRYGHSILGADSVDTALDRTMQSRINMKNQRMAPPPPQREAGIER